MTKIDTINPSPQQQQKSKFVPWAIFVAALVWDFIIPSVPVIGWIDDTLITLFASINLLQSTLGETNMYLVQILKIVKWICLGLGVIIFLLAALLGTLIFKLIKGL